MKKLLRIAVTICFAFLLTGCASIVSRSVYPLTIKSNPTGANVVVKDRYGFLYAKGTTPMNVRLRAGDGFFSRAFYTIDYTKPGYETVSVPVIFNIDGWYFGNIFLGGFLGMLIIDPATGAMWRLDYDQIKVTLDPDGSSVPELQIIEIDDLEDDDRNAVIRIY